MEALKEMSLINLKKFEASLEKRGMSVGDGDPIDRKIKNIRVRRGERDKQNNGFTTSEIILINEKISLILELELLIRSISRKYSRFLKFS